VSLVELNKYIGVPRGPALSILRSVSNHHPVEGAKILSFTSPGVLSRRLSTSQLVYSKQTRVEEVQGEEDPNAEGPKTSETPRDPERDRTMVIPLDVSMRYLESTAYMETYGTDPVWVMYRRNFKGQYAPKNTRKTCVRNGQLTNRNPCPICRDEFLVLDYRNVKLLKQFISPFNGAVLHWNKTGLCRVKQLDLLVEIEKAKDYGTISFDVPIRKYDYADYYGSNARNYR